MKTLIGFCVAFILITGGYYIFAPHALSVPSLVLGGKTFAVEVEDTPAGQELGLSGREGIENDRGMLFVFNKADNYGFWMKDMKFPIDMVWFDAALHVTHIEDSVASSTYPEVFYPGTPSLYVLEVGAGQAKVLGIKIGDAAILKLK